METATLWVDRAEQDPQSADEFLPQRHDGSRYNRSVMANPQLASFEERFALQRVTRRHLLKSALVTAGGLGALAVLGCDDEETSLRAGTPNADIRGAPTTQVGEIRTFDSGGVPIHYEVLGEGKPIVLVHGFAANLKVNWVGTGWIEALTPIRQVVALDARGHGLSGKPQDPEAYAGDHMENDVLRLMDHLDIQTADVFGYSMGAQIALRLVLRQPERFAAAVLGGVGDFAWRQRDEGPGDFGSRVSDALLADDPETITDPIAKAFRSFVEALNNDLEALAAYMRASRTPVDEAELSRVSLPVLIVNGEADTLAGSPDRLAAAIPGARMVKIPERDHLTVVADPRFKQVVVSFLTEHSQ